MDLLTYLKLDTAAFDAAATRAHRSLGGLSGAAGGLSGASGSAAASLDAIDLAADAAADGATEAAVAMDQLGGSAAAAASQVDGAASSMQDTGTTMKLAADQSGKTAAGLQGVSAVAGMLSGNVTGAARGAASLVGALKGLGIASAVTVGLALGLVVALALLAKTMIDARTKAARLTESIKLDNAQAGVDSLRRAYERLVDTMDGTVGLMRELRALTRGGDDVEWDTQLARLDNARKRDLSALAPGDEAGAREINQRYDRQRGGMELDREAAGNTAAAVEARRQREENAEAMAARRSRLAELAAESAAANRTAGGFGARAGQAKLNSTRDYNNEMADKWRGVAARKLEDAERVRAEIEELERKNKILAEQAKLYEKRNEVVEIKRAGLGIGEPPDAPQKEKEKGGTMPVSADRLTRIGGYMVPGAGGNKLETLTERQLAETRLMRVGIERMARDGNTATWGA